MINSKNKGKRGELAWCRECKKHGHIVTRSQQYCGTANSADCIGLKGIHQEIKFVEKLNIHNAMKQSISESANNEIPIIVHKRNRSEWLVTMRASDWFIIYKYFNCNKSL